MFLAYRTALHCAAELGHRDSVEELLDKGADPNIRDINGVLFNFLIGLPLDLQLKVTSKTLVSFSWTEALSLIKNYSFHF